VTFREGLAWLAGTGAGVLAFWLLDRLERSTSERPVWRAVRTWLVGLEAGDKRLVAFALVALIAWGAWGLGLLMAYELRPGNPRALVEQLFSAAAAAIVASQLAHGQVALRRKVPEWRAPASGQ
jgi:TctA family transporter